MVDARDWKPYLDAGLMPADASARAEREQLLELLIEVGCSLDEMVAADQRGRLFGLAGDRLVRPGARALTLGQVAEHVGGDEVLVRRLWRALGLAGWDSDEPLASVEDADALSMPILSASLVGEERVLELARAVCAALSRVGEATNAIGRAASPEGAIAISGSEVATARYWHGVAPFVPGVGRLLDVMSRHHFELAREHFERTQSWDVMSRRMTRLAVGFIDMSGFTAATEDLDEVEFGRLMASFSVQVDETVRDLGGRVVKFVGDAAMVVAPQPTDLTAIAHQLVTTWASLGPDLTLHAGLAYGELLNQDGDFYGRAVNLAARLGALAGPGEILGSALIGEALPSEEWHVAWLEPRSIRGMADPVVTCSIERLPPS